MRQNVQDSVVGSIESIEEYLHPADPFAEASAYIVTKLGK